MAIPIVVFEPSTTLRWPRLDFCRSSWLAPQSHLDRPSRETRQQLSMRGPESLLTSAVACPLSCSPFFSCRFFSSQSRVVGLHHAGTTLRTYPSTKRSRSAGPFRLIILVEEREQATAPCCSLFFLVSFLFPTTRSSASAGSSKPTRPCSTTWSCNRHPNVVTGLAEEAHECHRVEVDDESGWE